MTVVWSLKKRSVLVPFDFSDASVEAVAVARSFVDTDEAVTVLHVVAPPPPNAPGVLWGTTTPETVREHSEAAVVKAMNDQGLAVHVRTLIGQPAECIVDYVEQEGIELVVIPSHGRTGFKRFLLGSVAERVVRLATAPVLVLRRKSSKKDA